MIFFQLRICPENEVTRDHDVIAGSLPRIGEQITAPDGNVYFVKYVDYIFDRFDIESAPRILIVARWRL